MAHSGNHGRTSSVLSGAPSLQGAIDALLEIRKGLARAIDELPDIQRPVDVERALRIDRPLAWRMFKAARAQDAAEVMEHLPTTNQLLRVLGLARKRGVHLETVHAVEMAIARFDEAVRTAASDREAFGALLSGHSKRGISTVEQRLRRDGFRSNAHLWGSQCRTLAFMVALRPNPSGMFMDAVTLRGWVDLHASRPQDSTQLFSRFEIRKDDPSEETAQAQAAFHAGSLDVVQGFGSSDGNMELLTIDCAGGKQETHVRLPAVGREGRMTLFLRQQIECSAPVAGVQRMNHLVCKPAEVLLFDLLVPAGWANTEKAFACAYARPNDVSLTIELRAEDRIPLHDVPVCTPGVRGVPHTSDVPRWSELVDHVLAERGWLGEKFDVIRLRVAYPMLHSAIVLSAEPRIE